MSQQAVSLTVPGLSSSSPFAPRSGPKGKDKERGEKEKGKERKGGQCWKEKRVGEGIRRKYESRSMSHNDLVVADCCPFIHTLRELMSVRLLRVMSL